jgi:hypothetical protein
MLREFPFPLAGRGQGRGESAMKAVNGSGPPPTHPVKGGELSLRYGTLDEEFELLPWEDRAIQQKKPLFHSDWNRGFLIATPLQGFICPSGILLFC